MPVYEYVHPLSEVVRTIVGSMVDIGAYEYGIAVDAGVFSPDASAPEASSNADGAAGGNSGTGAEGGSGASSGSSGGGGTSGGAASSAGGGSTTGSASGGASAPDASAGTASGSRNGCGCELAGLRDGRGPGTAAVGLLLGLTTALVRRSRVRRA